MLKIIRAVTSKHNLVHLPHHSNAASAAQCCRLSAIGCTFPPWACYFFTVIPGLCFLVSSPGLTRGSISNKFSSLSLPGLTRQSTLQSTMLFTKNVGATRSLRHNVNNWPLRPSPVAAGLRPFWQAKSNNKNKL